MGNEDDNISIAPDVCDGLLAPNPWAQSGHIHHIKVHPLRWFAVRNKINVIAMPHRLDFLIDRGAEGFCFFGGKIINGEVVAHAATVSLPRAEFAEDAVIDQFLAIRRIAAKPTTGKRQLTGQATIGINRIEQADEIIE